MDEKNETTQGNELPETIQFVKDIHAETVTFGPGVAFRIDAAKDVTMNQAGAFGIAAGQDAMVSFGGAMAIAVGRDLKLDNGGGIVYAVGRDLQMNDAVAGMANVGGRTEMKDSLSVVSISNSSRLDQSAVGILITGSADLGEGNRILFTTPQAAALGAGFGLVFALVSWLLRKK